MSPSLHSNCPRELEPARLLNKDYATCVLVWRSVDSVGIIEVWLQPFDLLLLGAEQRLCEHV